VAVKGHYVRSTFFIGLKELVESVGGHFESLLGRVGMTLEDSQSVDKLMSFRAFTAFLELLAAETGVEDIGVRLTRISEPHFANLGPIVFLSRFTSDVRAWEVLAREYWDCQSNCFRFDLIEETSPGISILRYDLTGVGLPLRQQTEHTLANLFGVVRTIVGCAEEKPTKVTVRHLRLGNCRSLDDYMGCDVEYGAAHNDIIFRSEILDYKTAGDLSFFRGLLRLYVQSRLDQLTFQDGSAATHVKLAISSLLGTGKSDIKSIAELIGVHPKALQRHLSEEGAVFSELLEDVRKQMAMELLSHSKAPIAHISGLLGYSSTPAFTLAFKRWTNIGPSDWRAKNTQEHA
jgi:AraC-like DNA-binding protein